MCAVRTLSNLLRTEYRYSFFLWDRVATPSPTRNDSVPQTCKITYKTGRTSHPVPNYEKFRIQIVRDEETFHRQYTGTTRRSRQRHGRLGTERKSTLADLDKIVTTLDGFDDILHRVGTTFENCVSNAARVQGDSFGGVIIARNYIRDAIGGMVRVNDSNNRNTQLGSFGTAPL